MGTHSELSPSGAERWMVTQGGCPGSVRMSRNAPPEKPSRQATEGTHAHSCLEFVVKRFKANPAALRAHVLRNKKWNEEMFDHAMVSAKNLFRKLKPDADARLMFEQKVTLDHIHKSLYGTLDYAWVGRSKLVVMDYKYGRGVPVFPVDEETGKENPQIMIYASGIARKLRYNFKDIDLVIDQPRTREPGDELPVHTISINRLKGFEKELKESVKAALDPKAPLIPSKNACRWCRAATICPAASTDQMENVGILFDTESGELQGVPEAKLISKEKLSKVLDACDLIETWIGKVREHAFETATGGERIPGYKLVNKRGTRKWAAEAQRAAEKIWKGNLYDLVFPSPAQLEKKFGKDAKAFAEKYSTSVSSGVTLVPASDKRTEVTDVLEFDIEGDDE